MNKSTNVIISSHPAIVVVDSFGNKEVFKGPQFGYQLNIDKTVNNQTIVVPVLVITETHNLAQVNQGQPPQISFVAVYKEWSYCRIYQNYVE